MDWLGLIALLLLVIAVLAACYWVIVALRVRRALRAAPTVRAGLRSPSPPDGWPSVSIVVPAHNEEHVIDDCARSLRAQRYERVQIIFVLDRCTDATAAILKPHAQADDRIIIVATHACPDDWAGKCNAAAVGASRASGEWLLFTDADTRFDPDLVRASIGLALQRELDLLSLLSTLTATHAFERIAQPVATMALMRLYPIDLINRPGSRRVFANGQFMLFRSDVYERIGGHASVRGDLLEDIAFARQVRRADGRCGVFLADGMLVVSMYDSAADFFQGWKRIFIEACKRKPGRMRKNAWRLLIAGVIFPCAQALGLTIAAVLAMRGEVALGTALMAIVLFGWLVQGATLRRTYVLAGAPPWAAVLYPLGCWRVARIFFQGAGDLARRRPIRWGGRDYVLEPR